MSEEYNCFKCKGYDLVCPTYFGLKEENKCSYKKVADHDLQKWDEGRNDLTLINMLQKYLGIEIPIKKPTDDFK